MAGDDELPVFRPFTRDELATIDNRIFENKLAAKKRKARREKNIAVRIFLHFKPPRKMSVTSAEQNMNLPISASKPIYSDEK